MLFTGLISFQWIAQNLFANTYIYLLDNNSSVGQNYPSFEQLGYRVCTMDALMFMYDRILNYKESLGHND